MDLPIKKNKFVYILLSLGTLSFIISSGISTTLRMLGLILIVISFFINLFRSEIKVGKNIILASLFFSTCFTIGVFRTILIGNDYSDIFRLTLLLVILFPLLVLLYSSFRKSYIPDVITFVSWSIIILFFSLFFSLFILRHLIGPSILLFLGNFKGGFYYRQLGIIDNFPSIWFQASIIIMPLAVYNLFLKKHLLFFLLAFVVFLSLNRTGSFIILIIFLISLIKNQKSIAFYFVNFIFILPFVFLLVCVITNSIYSNNFISSNTGFDIRLGQLIGVTDDLSINGNLFFGMGADSQFTSLAYEDVAITNNQEISYLEILRRFGIFGYLLFNFGVSISLLHFYKRANWPSFYSLFVYIIFSFTNPSLISLIFIIFYAIIQRHPHPSSRGWRNGSDSHGGMNRHRVAA